MNDLTPRQLRGLFVAIEVNLTLWLAVCGFLWSTPSLDDLVKQTATAGMIVAAVLQHWAYYNLYRRAKKQKEHSKPTPAPVPAKGATDGDL